MLLVETLPRTPPRGVGIGAVPRAQRLSSLCADGSAFDFNLYLNLYLPPKIGPPGIPHDPPRATALPRPHTQAEMRVSGPSLIGYALWVLVPSLIVVVTEMGLAVCRSLPGSREDLDDSLAQ